MANPVVVIDGDYGHIDQRGGSYPKRVRVRVEGEVTRWIASGSSGHPHTQDVHVTLLLHRDGSVTWDNEEFASRLL